MLRDLDLLVVDAQATGASPKHGAVLELAHAVTRASLREPPEVRAHWVELPPGVRVSRVVRELTGYTDGCRADAKPARDAWGEIASSAAALGVGVAPTIIHFAQFETPFLVDLHARFGAGSPFPLDIVCLHAVARRLYPDLPRSNIRALAGFLGHTTPHERRARGHVLATAHVWSILSERLAERGITTWEAMADFLGATPSRRSRRTYPMDKALRAALPDAPGVYRFKRSNGDVLYVGKATSLKKRVASHYTGAKRAPSRAQEMLTQALDIDYTVAPTPLDAALLEVAEIKRLDPPYNVHLRDRRAWFASRALDDASEVVSDLHPFGPLPAPNTAYGLGALLAFRRTGEAPPLLRARAMQVPLAFAPDERTFRDAFAAFVEAHALGPRRSGGRDAALHRVAARLSLREEAEPETPTEDVRAWDAPRVLRHIERSAGAGARALARARWLTVLAGAHVHVVDGGVARAFEPLDPSPTARARKAGFDGARYDWLRVLNTELKRVAASGGDVRVDVRTARGSVTRLEGPRLAALLARS
ncbi:MAG: GIY-YIG nuclease family protein [Polyangiaceae bacterium]